MKYAIIFIFSLFVASCTSTTKIDVWQPLFNGENLENWDTLPGGTWTVENGVIIGKQSPDEKRHGMLVSKESYTDFEVKLSYKAVKGNSGFYFRSEKVNHAVGLKGFQVEIDTDAKDPGGLYETLGRSWVSRVSAEKVKTFYRSHEWNEMFIRAKGGDIDVFVNGVQTASLKNDTGNLKGHFGLQMHGKQDMHIEFKEIYIRPISVKK